MIGLQLNLVIGMVTLALGFIGGLGLGRMQGDQKIAKLQIAYTLEKANLASLARQSERLAREEEQRRIAKLAEAADVAHKQASKARTDAQRADYAAVELRRAYLAAAGALTRKRPADPAAAGASAPAAGPGLVFAELFGRGDATLRECASALDQSRIAGLACERAYDALRVEP